MLVDVNPASLESTPAHLSVESKVSEARVLRKPVFSKYIPTVTDCSRGARKSASPVGKSVGNAQEMYPSVLNSSMGTLPFSGQGTIWSSVGCLWCTDFLMVSFSVIFRATTGMNVATSAGSVSSDGSSSSSSCFSAVSSIPTPHLSVRSPSSGSWLNTETSMLMLR